MTSIQPYGTERCAEPPGLWPGARRYLLDTNTCIYIINRRPPGVFERFRQRPAGSVAISSITAAAKQLHLAQPTLSNQIRRLEKSIGSPLFARRGRGLALTETGQTVMRYADEIFALGQELTDVVRGEPSPGVFRLTVGVPDVLPKLVVYRLLRPALELAEPLRLVTFEGKLDDLLGDLASHKLDVLLSETPLPATARIRAFNHLLGVCSLTCFAAPELARRLRPRFPKPLDRPPALLATSNRTVRRPLAQRCDDRVMRQ